MKPITLEWVAKAEGDWDAAQREYRARQRPNDEACQGISIACAWRQPSTSGGSGGISGASLVIKSGMCTVATVHILV
jgi:hypothetical protein